MHFECAGNASAIGVFLFGSAHLATGSLSAAAQKLNDAVKAAGLSAQSTTDAFTTPILLSLDADVTQASPNVSAILVAAALGAGASPAIQQGFAQVCLYVVSPLECLRHAGLCVP